MKPTTQRWLKLLLPQIFVLLFILTGSLYAAAPVVNTTITVSKTGSDPFDATTWDGADLTTAGLDSDEDNNVTRMQDSTTYRVEVSVNDASVDNLVATVMLPDGKQKWITIPTGCETDAALVNPVSSISADGYTMICNTGKAIEGTTKVVFPAAKVMSYNEVTNEPVLNDDTTIARVSATASGANTATAGDTTVVITAAFKVDTTKTLKVPGLNPKTGAPLYHSLIAKGPNGEAGYLIEYKINVSYGNGSMLIDTANEAGGDYLTDIDLFDIYTNDNNSSTGTGGVSSGGILYTWGDDGAAGGCNLEGDHGATATVTCRSTNFDAATGTASTTAAFNGISPTLPATNDTSDGLDDPNVEIELRDIDVRDPDGDGKVVELNLVLWFSKADDVASSPTCADAGGCQVFTVNSVGILNGTTIEGYNPVSTEDASGNNLPNYAGSGEPIPNEIDFPLIHVSPGGWSANKLFNGYSRPGSSADYWPVDKEVSGGQIIQYGTAISDHRANDQVGQSCDKIDTTSFEFLGLWDPASGEDTIAETAYWGDYYPEDAINPRVYVYGGGNGFTHYAKDLPSTYTVLYSSVPVLAGGATTPELTYMDALRTSRCDDDVDGDGQVRIKLKDGKVYDKTLGGVEITDGGPIDWYEATGYSVGGIDPTIQGNVTRVREEYRTDESLFASVAPGYTYTGFYASFDLKIKPDATGYGAGDFLPNFLSYRNDLPISWVDAVASSSDINSTSFAKHYARADRVQLVNSSISIKKVTEPQGIKIVKAGDLVDFIVTPGVWGLWTGEETAMVSDAVPAGTKYVAGSEMFSIDGGTTWLSYNDYQALASADVSLTSAAQAAGATPLVWEFGDLSASATGSDQLPMIKYTVEVDPTATNASYTNVVKLTSNIDNNNSNNPVSTKYNIKVLPSSGLEILKRNDQAVYNTNTPFNFDLVYKNLGGESYSTSEFIDILPYNGDGAGVTGGLGSAREPATTYQGSLLVSQLSGSNGETFMMTSADPSTIPQDPCHEDNQPAGYVPVAGDTCYEYYISSNTSGVPVKVANTFAGGASEGTGVIPWVPFAANTAGTTAIRFVVPSIAQGAGAKKVHMQITPIGNKGGTPSLDALGNVEAASTGDIYTNTFSGRVPEISLLVISNDVSVTVVSGSIGDYVWFDANSDGVQDASEAPLANVTLKLLDGAGAPIMVDANGTVVPSGTAGAVPYVTQTDASGKYLFENLPAGDYKVEVDTTTLPAGVIPTYDNDGVATANTSSHTLLAEVDPITGELTGVEDNLDQDFGYYIPQGSWSGNVSMDSTGDGVGDTMLPDVAIKLTKPDGSPVTDIYGNPVAPVLTDAFGNYTFENLPIGDYIAVETQPVGVVSLSENEGGLDNDKPDNGIVNSIAGTVVDGENDQNNDFVEAVIISTIAVEKSTNGQDADTTGSGPTVDLGSTVTWDYNVTNTGNIALENISLVDNEEGTVVCPKTTLDVAESMLCTKTGIAIEGEYENIATVSGRTRTGTPVNDLDPSHYTGEAGTWSGNVSEDTTGDTNGDTPIEGVEIKLYPDFDGDGQPDLNETALVTTTDANGDYTFEHLVPGDYVAVETQPSAYLDVKETEGGADTDGTDAGVDNAISGHVDAGEEDSSNDFVEEKVGAWSGNVSTDTNNDNIGDAPLAGVEIKLYPDYNGDGQPDLNETALVTTTDANGNYLFENLVPGDYVAVETQPAGLLDVAETEGGADGDGTDAGAMNTISGHVDAGETDASNDFIDEEKGSLSGQVQELLPNGNMAPMADVNLTLTDSTGAVIGTVLTDSNGEYTFADLVPGEYTVTETQPADYSDIAENEGGADNDKPDDGVPNSIQAIVSAGEQDTANDFFEEKTKGSLSGKVTEDTTGDGTGDTPISGVELTLLDSDGNVVATAVTDADGNYTFPNLVPGDYTVVKTQPENFTAVGETEGGTDGDKPDDGVPNSIAATVDSGENDAGNNFVDEETKGSLSGQVQELLPNGNMAPMADVNLTLTDSTGAVIGTVLTDSNGEYTFADLVPGEYTVTETQPADYSDIAENEGGADNDKPDDGVPNSIQAIVSAGEQDTANDFFEEKTKGSLSGKVTEDTTGDGTGDTPISGVELTLLDSDGNVVATAVTDADGNYTFPNLVPGDYTVVKTQPENFTAVGETEGGTDGDKPDDGVPNSIAATVDSGENDAGNDFVDETERGVITGKVEERLENGSINPLPNVSLTLLDSDGNEVATVLTDSNGEYTFPNLVPGDYTVVETQPDGYYDIREDEGGADNDKADDGVVNSIAATVAPGETDLGNDFIEGELGSLTGKVTQQFTDGGSEPLENVYLVLKDIDGNVVASTYTDEYGDYKFEGLMPGDYTVEETQPPGYNNLSENEGGTDSDGNNAKVNTISAKVGAGENDTENDFVETKMPKPTATPTPTPTATPTPDATDITHESAIIHWENVEGEFGYKIYNNGQLVAVVGADQTSYTLDNLESGVEYSYDVVAFNGQGDMESQVIKFKAKESQLGWFPALLHILLN